MKKKLSETLGHLADKLGELGDEATNAQINKKINDFSGETTRFIGNLFTKGKESLKDTLLSNPNNLITENANLVEIIDAEVEENIE